MIILTREAFLVDDCNKVITVFVKLNTKTESDNIISHYIKYVHQTSRFTFLI
jgi:hypothetical protein